MNEPPFRVEIEGIEAPAGAENDAARRRRPWVGIHFDCCGVYARVYRDGAATIYEGRCPRCLRKVKLRVGPGGTDSRFFRAE